MSRQLRNYVFLFLHLLSCTVTVILWTRKLLFNVLNVQGSNNRILTYCLQKWCLQTIRNYTKGDESLISYLGKIPLTEIAYTQVLLNI